MIIVVIHKKSQLKNLLQILEDMYKAKEEIKSVYISLKEEANNIILGEELRHYFGAKYIEEEIEGLKFKIYPDSFFQVNKKQAEKLYNKAIEFFGEIEDKTIVDAFSGTGTIGMLLAKKAKNVIGIESIESSVMSAKESALENNIENIKFICGKVEKEFSKVMKSEKIDGVIFDPPRKGIDEKVLNVLKENRVPSLVYISCNPSTFARDAKILDDLGYKLEKIASVDMFSQTHHIEVVAKFVDKK
jgi:23S rRNA (uracil1939-C5)-methyltransferase